jgi:hypothetical protein
MWKIIIIQIYIILMDTQSKSHINIKDIAKNLFIGNVHILMSLNNC